MSNNIIKTCLNCKIEFEIPVWRKEKAKFCSKKCACIVRSIGNKWSKPRGQHKIKSVCIECKKTFKTWASQLKYGGAKYCSYSCRTTNKNWKNKWAKTGKDHHFWKGGVTAKNILIRQSSEYKEWRRQVFKRDFWTCQICKKKGKPIEADHIKPFCLYPELRFDINNGRTLCKMCHKEHGWNYFKEKYKKEEQIRTSINSQSVTYLAIA